MEESKAGEDDMAADSKFDPARGETPSSIESSPEPDGGAEQSHEPAQPQKRKGGRKPIYATSEERKQRNRQAQAAFRERRTEYIKQLEATIKQNEDTLTTLQQSHRTAADECLMLRYKNSLLERILLEKGIDVQAELALKTGSPTLSFQHPGANAPQVPPPQPQLQRTAMQRHHARRSGQFLPKLAPGSSNPDSAMPRSPAARPTPPSHTSSPTTVSAKSPMIMQTGGNTPPTSAVLAQPRQQQYPGFPHGSQPSPNPQLYPNQQIPPSGHRPGPPRHYQSSTSVHSNHSTGSRQSLGAPMSAGLGPPGAETSGPQLYSDPFRNHISQLEQEYDAQQSRSMLDQSDTENLSDPSPNRLRGHYPPQFDRQHPRQGDYYQPGMDGPEQPQMAPPQQHMQAASNVPELDGQFAALGEMIDATDPMLDADPFGLSASMHYPTSYSFEQAPQR